MAGVVVDGPRIWSFWWCVRRSGSSASRTLAGGFMYIDRRFKNVRRGIPEVLCGRWSGSTPAMRQTPRGCGLRFEFVHLPSSDCPGVVRRPRGRSVRGARRCGAGRRLTVLVLASFYRERSTGLWTHAQRPRVGCFALRPIEGSWGLEIPATRVRAPQRPKRGEENVAEKLRATPKEEPPGALSSEKKPSSLKTRAPL